MKKRISFILVLFFGLLAFDAQAELSIDITGARSEPMAVAMPDFAGNNEKAKELGKKIRDIIQADLESSGLFKVLDSYAYLQTFKGIDEAPRFVDWQAIRAEALERARLLDENAAGKYYSVAGDAAAFAELITRWLEDNGRTGSLVYILGESYGTIRNLALADALPDSVNLRGIVHIGVSFNVGARGAMYVEPNVRRLGANAAACHWHYHREMDETEFVKSAMDFAYGEYARALLLGSRLDSSERERVLDRLSYFTGLSREMLDRNGLRFSEPEFMLGLVPGAMLSMYDSRLTHVFAPGEDGSKYDFKYDPFMERASNVFDTALARYAESELAAPEGRESLSSSTDIALRWDYASYQKDTLTLPAELMKARPELRMLFVSGRYDLSSTFDFVDWYLSHYDLDPARTDRLALPSGHASYVGAGMAEALSHRIREFIR